MGQAQVVLGGTILLVHTAPHADLIIPTMLANHSIVHSGTPQMQHSTTMHKMHLQTSTLALNATHLLITHPISGHNYTVHPGGSQTHHSTPMHKMYTQTSTQPFDTM